MIRLEKWAKVYFEPKNHLILEECFLRVCDEISLYICDFCSNPYAPIKCYYNNCNRYFHLMCLWKSPSINYYIFLSGICEKCIHQNKETLEKLYIEPQEGFVNFCISIMHIPAVHFIKNK